MLNSYQDISFDTLHVFPDEGAGTGYQYNGRRLDSHSITIVTKTMYGDNYFDTAFYACYKFRIEGNRIGLITRTPGEYEASSIKLFVLDTACCFIMQAVSYDTTVDVTDQFVTLDFSAAKVDTLSTDSTMLANQFGHLLK